MIKKNTTKSTTESKSSPAIPQNAAELKNFIIAALDEEKAENTQLIDLKGKSDMADYMVITTGRSNRHVGALADNLMKKLKDIGVDVAVEGLQQCDWVLIDAYDIIIHIFRQEIREIYNLEKMWSMTLPATTSSSS